MLIVDDQCLGLFAAAVVYVLWDIENCSVPHDCDPTTIVVTIKNSLKKIGYMGSVKIVAVAANKSRVCPDIVKMLTDNSVKLHVLDSEEKQVSDEHIKKLIINWTKGRSPPANIMLISGWFCSYTSLAPKTSLQCIVGIHYRFRLE